VTTVPRHHPTVLLYCSSYLRAIADRLSPHRGAGRYPFDRRSKTTADQLKALRDIEDHARPAAIRDLAEKIQLLPASGNKLRLALGLASKSTEGDFGRPAVQAAATTLAGALREKPIPWTALSESGDDKFSEALLPAYGYNELAQLEHYEHVTVSLKGDPHCRAAIGALNAMDVKRAHLDFELKDRTGKTRRLSDLRGHVVIVNFWAIWCPPCRKEIPDLENLYRRFAGQGLVVLGISDEEAPKIDDFLKIHPIAYPVLLDSDRVVNRLFSIHGIPKSFVYDRSGKLVAQAIRVSDARGWWRWCREGSARRTKALKGPFNPHVTD
jgi:peroxiredoxin